jgi:hypothetical protein
MRLLFDRPTVFVGLVGLLAGTAWLASAVLAGDDSPKEGKAAPKVDLPAYGIGTLLPDKKDAKTMNLADFKGKKHVVLYFFPKALTGG